MNKRIGLLLISILSLTLLIVGCNNKGSNTQDSSNSNNSTPVTNEQSVDEPSVKEESEEQTPQTEAPIDEEKTDESQKEVTIYEYNVDEDNLIETAVTLDKVDENTLFSKLKDLGVISKTANLNSFKIEDIDGINTAVIDVDSNFINSNLGSGAEEYMLKAFANTYIKNMNVSQIKLTVDGSNYESGHIILEDGDFLK